jgi:inhibitor of KinA sporulation pathway (predicted exonuclease)
LKETGLDFDGREHSGIADAKNTAKLLGRFQRYKTFTDHAEK